LTDAPEPRSGSSSRGRSRGWASGSAAATWASAWSTSATRSSYPTTRSSTLDLLRPGPLRAQVNLKNLTDKEYFTGNGRFVIPGDPFTVLGQLTWNFRW